MNETPAQEGILSTTAEEVSRNQEETTATAMNEIPTEKQAEENQ